MSEPVITLKGACEGQSKTPASATTHAGAKTAAERSASGASSGCVSSMTRAQFEKLTDALQPPDRGPVPPEVRRKFATQYAKLLTLSDIARELGLENDPKVQQILAFARNQILAERVNSYYQEKYSHPTDKQIEDYYNQNLKKYREATLERIIIPMAQQSGDKDKPVPTADEEKAFAEKLRQRWVAGEDPAKLEKEAMEHSGNTSSNPDINLGARRPGSLPEAHETVFDMKAGEVSPVFADPAVLYIYKVVSERQVPLADVKSTISQTLQRQMFTDKMAEVQGKVTPVLNDAYFGPEPPANSGAPMRPGMPGMGRPVPGGRATPGGRPMPPAPGNPAAAAPLTPPAPAATPAPAPPSQDSGASPK